MPNFLPENKYGKQRLTHSVINLKLSARFVRTPELDNLPAQPVTINSIPSVSLNISDHKKNNVQIVVKASVLMIYQQQLLI